MTTQSLEQLLAERIATDAAALAREIADRWHAAERDAHQDDRQWRILHWREFGAHSLDVTAAVIGVSEPTVRRLIDDKALESVQGLGAGSRRTVPVWSIKKYLGE